MAREKNVDKLSRREHISFGAREYKQRSIGLARRITGNLETPQRFDMISNEDAVAIFSKLSDVVELTEK